ncbi:MAG: substrate-binding domain-containing protein [Chloroflexi bacterium]|nr:substrate-binding domain-containing protein [Chloroflexota bacterium]
MSRVRSIGYLLLGALIMAGVVGVVLAAESGETEVRISARRIDSGGVEVALQQAKDDGAWGVRQLPAARFLPADAETGVWHTSNPLTVSVTRDQQRASPSAVDLPNFDNAVLICAITHQREGDQAFWFGVNQGLMGWDREHPQARVEIRSGGTAAEQSQHVRECVDNGAAAITITMPAPEGLREALAEAAAAGLMITSFNSGSRSFRDFGSIRHVSIDEFEGGRVVAQHLTAHGVTGLVLCITHEPNNIALNERCEGLEAGYAGDVERFSVAAAGTADLAATREAIADRLRHSTSPVRGLVTLNALVGLAARDATRAAESDAVIVTFDQTRDVLEAILAGEILFAIDTQPYNQGYFAGAATLHTYSAWRGISARYRIDANHIIGSYAITLEPRLLTDENADSLLILSRGRPGSNGGRPDR